MEPVFADNYFQGDVSPLTRSTQTVFLVDADEAACNYMVRAFRKKGLDFITLPSAKSFLSIYEVDHPGCLVLDANLPDLSGLDLQQELIQRKINIPTIFISAQSDTRKTVQAMKNGAFDFLDKPCPPDILIERIEAAFAKDRAQREAIKVAKGAACRFEDLTEREREIAALIVASSDYASSKAIGKKLGISHRTVDQHKAHIMSKTRTHSVIELIQLAQKANFPKV